MRQHTARRSAFTLVELLVAAAIISMMLAVVAMYFPRINEREQLTRAVDKLRTGILTSRLWSRRDQVITGIQLVEPVSSVDGTVSYGGFIYLQQPLQAIAGGAAMGGSLNQVVVFASPGQTPPNLVKVKPNLDFPNERDYLLLESDMPHRISAVDIPNSVLTLESPILIPLRSNHPFRIVRAAEPIPLQEVTPFGDNIVVKLTNTAQNRVLFLPNGQVFNSPVTNIGMKVIQTRVDGEVEESDVTLDCLSGATRYRTP